MTMLFVALSVGLALVALALVNAFGPGGYAWSNRSARLAMVTQTFLGMVLVAGALAESDNTMWFIALAGWGGGSAMGVVISAFRARVQRAPASG